MSWGCDKLIQVALTLPEDAQKVAVIIMIQIAGPGRSLRVLFPSRHMALCSMGSFCIHTIEVYRGGLL